MIQINSFFPTDNLTRSICEFHDDKIVTKIRSLANEFEREIKYEKIKYIRTKRTADLRWIWITFAIFGFVAIADLALHLFDVSNATTDFLVKIIAAAGLLLMIPTFRKDEFYYFLDAERNPLTAVKVDNDKKREQIFKAISLVKQKTEILTETYLSDILPSDQPIFEIVAFDFPDFLNTSTTMFFEDRIVEMEKNVVEEYARVTKYHELNGKTKTVRLGNDHWDSLWCFWMQFVCITGLSISFFFSQQIIGNVLLLKLFLGGLALIIPMYFLKYIKSEFLVFHDTNEKEYMGIGINNRNRETINQIVEFVKRKVESEEIKPA